MVALMSLTAHNIQLIRHKKTILQDVSLAVQPGEILALLGPNGAGKSTLLQAISGELPIQSGTLNIQNIPRTAWELSKIAQVLAVLPQLDTLHFPLTVLEVVMLGRIPHATSAAENQTIAELCLQMVDMLALKDRQYTWLSGGERQRAQIARVLAQIYQSSPEEARYLLLDEPTSALDLAHQHQLFKLLRELTRQKIGIVVTVHDLNLAMLYADRVILLQEGKVMDEGLPMAVLTAENIARVFALNVNLIPHPTIPGKAVIAA